jgi:3-methyladenine DNA glycosylase/8-oxoguanine DNA glycosylase
MRYGVSAERSEEMTISLGQSFQFYLQPVPPFDFELTVKKPVGWNLFNAGEILEGKTFWTATRLKGIMAGIRMESLGTIDDPRVRVSVFTKSKVAAADRKWMVKHLKTMIGADQDLESFYAMAKKDDILKITVKDLYGMHDTQTSYLYNSVVLSICLQMARLDRSNKMIESINEHYGDPVAFDGKMIRVEPSAERIAGLKAGAFAKECNLGYRAKYLIRSAQMIVKGFPTSEQILSMSLQEAKSALMELPGVGDYAADIINPHGGFPIDAWSVDVFGLLFFGKEPKNARAMIEKVKREGLKRWGNWAWMGFFYVAQDLENLSKSLGVRLRRF